jgi:hypothetical protein
MPNIIKPKRSSVPGKVPTTGDIVSGEIAINNVDSKIYQNNGTTVVQVGAGKLTALSDVVVTSPTTGQSLAYNGTNWVNSNAGAGDVVGAASSTDNAITRFDGTTGKVIQNSTVTLDDNGNFVNVNSVGLDITPATVPATVGTMSWDDGDGVPSVLLKGGNTTLQVGTQEYARVYNDSGATLTIGQVVYISGAQGNRVAVKLARANVESTSFGTLGLVAESIANGAEGFIIVSGALYKLNTIGLTAGAAVYLSPTTAGAYTTTEPQAPNQLVVLGFVERVHATVGSIYVKIDNGYELTELHDVQITSPTSGNTLIYDAAVGVWKNANLTAGTGVSVTNGAGSITIANTGVTSAVAGTGITVSGATGAVTVTNSDRGSSQNIFKNVAVAGQTTIVADGNDDTLTIAAGTGITLTTNATTDTLTITGTGGTVTGVTGTSPVVSSGGSAPAISLASGYGDTQNPYASKTANNFLAAPNGSAGVPTFRAIVAADIPTLNQNTTGTASNVTGTVAIANGGTGETTRQAAMDALAGAVTSGQYLRGNGTDVVMSAIQAADVPTLNQNTTGTASNVTGTVAIANGGTGATTNTAARTNLGATTLGANIFTIANPSAITFPRFNADNTISALDAATFRTAIGAGTGSGTVTSVGGTGTVNGITLSGTVTSSGNLTLGGTLSGVSLTTQVSGTLPIANGGTNATTAATALTNLGAYPASNPNGYTSNTGTVTSVATGTGLTGGTITTSGTISLTGQALALNNLATNGLIARTGAGTVAARTLTASTGISVSNGDGVSGNPTVTNTGVTSIVAGTNITISGGTGAVTINASGGSAPTDYGAVGTYVVATVAGSVSANSTYAGSSLIRSSSGDIWFNGWAGYVLVRVGETTNLGLSGTWRALSTSTSSGSYYGNALMVRIS